MSATLTPHTPFSASSLLGTPTGELTLRIRGPEHTGRLIRLTGAKSTIGSGATCSLRLKARGVEPLHCLILRGPQGTLVRALGPSVRVNGVACEDAPLAAGDALEIGGITLEVVTDEGARRLHAGQRQRFLGGESVETTENVAEARRTQRRLQHARLRRWLQALRADRQKAAEQLREFDRRRQDIELLHSQLAQMQRELRDERDRGQRTEDQRRSMALSANQLQLTVERLRHELHATQTQQQQEADLFRQERCRLNEELTGRERHAHQLRVDLQQRLWDLEQLRLQVDRQERQQKLEQDQFQATRLQEQQIQETWQTERSRLTEELTTRSQAVAQLRSDLAGAQQTIEQLQKDLRSAQAFGERAETDTYSALATNQQLEAELLAAKTAGEQLAAELKQKLSAAEQGYSTVKAERDQLATQASRAQGEVERLTQEATEKRRAWDEDLSQLHAAISHQLTEDEWHAERVRLLESIAGRDRELDDLRTEMRSRVAAASALEQQIAQQVQELTTAQANWQAEREQLQQSIAAAEERVAQTSAHAEELGRTLATAESALEEWKRSADERQARIEQLEGKLASQNAMLAAQAQQTIALDTTKSERFQSLERRVGELSDEKQQLEQRLVDASREAQAESARLAEKNEQLAHRERELQEKQAQLDSQQETLAAQTDEIAARSHAAATQEQALAERQTRLAEEEQTLANRRAELTSEAETLASERAALESRVAELEVQRQELAARPAPMAEPMQTLALPAREMEPHPDHAALTQEREQLAQRERELQEKQMQLESQQQALTAQAEEIAASRAEVANESANLVNERTVLEARAAELEQQRQELAARPVPAAEPMQTLALPSGDVEQLEQDRAALAEEREQLSHERADIERVRQQLSEQQTSLMEQERALEDQAKQLAEMREALELQQQLPAQPAHEADRVADIDEPAPVAEEPERYAGAERPELEAEPPPSQTLCPSGMNLTRLAGLDFDAQPAVSESGSRPASSVEEVLARLGKQGLWKSDAAEPAATPAPGSPFPVAEEVVEESPASLTPSPAAWRAPPASNPVPAENDEESIDDYMARLMNRVRGDEPPTPGSSSARPVPQRPVIESEKNSDPALQPAREAPKGEYSPRTTAPEQSHSLAAMREIANETARSAIRTHEKKSGKQRDNGHLIGAVVLGLMAMPMIWLAWWHQSWMFAVGSVLALCLASWWLRYGGRAVTDWFGRAREEIVLSNPKPSNPESK